jgi:hypothetical protein
MKAAATYLIASDDQTRCLIVGMPDGHTDEDLRIRIEAMRLCGPWFELTPEILETFGVTP